MARKVQGDPYGSDHRFGVQAGFGRKESASHGQRNAFQFTDLEIVALEQPRQPRWVYAQVLDYPFDSVGFAEVDAEAEVGGEADVLARFLR